MRADEWERNERIMIIDMIDEAFLRPLILLTFHSS